MGVVVLTNSEKVALVDDDMIEILAAHRWNVDKDGYVRRSVRHEGKVRTIRIHRFILSLSWGDINKDVDHINFNKLDNRRENLRLLPPSQNRGRHYHAQLAIWEKQR